MTNPQTVPVPVELLQRLKADYPLNAAMGRSVIAQLAALAPVPVKVGDTVTAETLATLPRKAAIRDADGDIWLVLNDGMVGFVDPTDLAPEGTADLFAYGPVTLVSLPRD